MRTSRQLYWTNPKLVGMLGRLGCQVDGRHAMAYEISTASGVLRLQRVHRRWAVEFNGRLAGDWPSPDAAAKAASRHRSGLPDWDDRKADLPADLLDWRPLGESI